jgi:hypothetical protein
VAPLQDPFAAIEALGKTHPGIPQLAHGNFLLPVKNMGELHVLQLHATVRSSARAAEAELRGLAPGEIKVLTLGEWGELPSFTVRLEATAADGSQATSCARFDADLDRYL